MTQRSKFDHYFFGGGLETDAIRGVAQAIAELETAGVVPAHTAPNPSASTAEAEREALRLKGLHDWIDRMNQGSIRMSTDEAYRIEVSKKLS